MAIMERECGVSSRGMRVRNHTWRRGLLVFQVQNDKNLGYEGKFTLNFCKFTYNKYSVGNALFKVKLGSNFSSNLLFLF